MKTYFYMQQRPLNESEYPGFNSLLGQDCVGKLCRIDYISENLVSLANGWYVNKNWGIIIKWCKR